MAKMNLMEFARETRKEIAKVTWPTRRETVVTTAAIVVMALAAGLFFFGVDAAIGFSVAKILGMSS